MYEYYLFNHASIASLQGQTLTFYATNDEHAIELGKKYAKMLGWEHYSVVVFNGEEEITLYDISMSEVEEIIDNYNRGVYSLQDMIYRLYFMQLKYEKEPDNGDLECEINELKAFINKIIGV